MKRVEQGPLEEMAKYLYIRRFNISSDILEPSYQLEAKQKADKSGGEKKAK